MRESNQKMKGILVLSVILCLVGGILGGCKEDGIEGHQEAFRDGTLTQVLSNLLGQEMRVNPPMNDVHQAVRSVNNQQDGYGGPPPPLPPQQQYNSPPQQQQGQYGPPPKVQASGTSFKGTRTSKGSRSFGFEFSFGDRIKPLQRGPRPPPPPAKQQQQQQYGPGNNPGPPAPPPQNDKFRQGPNYGPPQQNQQQQQQYGPPQQNQQQQQYGPPPGNNAGPPAPPPQNDKFRQGPNYGPPPQNQQQYSQQGYSGNQQQQYGPPPQQQQQQQQYGPPPQQQAPFRTSEPQTQPQQQYGPPQMVFIPHSQLQQYGVPQGFQAFKMNVPIQNEPLRAQVGVDTNSLGVGGRQQDPSVDTKFVYLFAPPVEPIEAPQKPQVISYPGSAAGREKNYQIIFVKTPAGPAPAPVEIQMPPAPERKTMVYVLVKKPTRDQPNIRFTSPPTTTPSPPEVFFVKYRRNENMPSTSEFKSLPESIQDNLMDMGRDEDAEIATGGYSSGQGRDKLRSTSEMGGGYSSGQRREKFRSNSEVATTGGYSSGQGREKFRSSSDVSGGYSRSSESMKLRQSSGSKSHYRAPGSRTWEEEEEQGGYQ